MNPLKWKRSEEGSTETHCGHYGIEPIWNHATTPQGYNLYFYPRPHDARSRLKLNVWLDTQTECKDAAARHHNKAHAAKYTIVRLTRDNSQPIEVALKWQDEDGPTAEDMTEAVVALVRRHWIGVGDTITVTDK